MFYVCVDLKKLRNGILSGPVWSHLPGGVTSRYMTEGSDSVLTVYMTEGRMLSDSVLTVNLTEGRMLSDSVLTLEPD